MNTPSLAIVRGQFLNRYEMQFFEPLVSHFRITAFGSRRPYHDRFPFPVVKLSCPTDLPDFPYKMPILNRLFVDAHYLWGLEDKLNGFDLVHTAETYFHYTQQCLEAKRQGKVGKVVATVLENIPHNNEGIWGRRIFKRRALRELDHIIALTNRTKDALLAEGADPRKITVISHFVDTKRFTPKKIRARRAARGEKRRLTVLFVGRLETYKGIYDIVDAVAQLEQDERFHVRDVTLRFVGDGSQKNTLERYMLPRLKKWHFTIETANYDRMPAIYQQADVFIAPSKSRTVHRLGKDIVTWEEQYCTALLEAQASGLPIVTTRSGGIPENVADAAVLVEPGDVPALAQALGEFLLSQAHRDEFGAKARKRAVGVHDIRIGAAKLRRLYTSLLSGTHEVK